MSSSSDGNDNSAVHRAFLARAVSLAKANVTENAGRPFGAVLVRDGKIMAEAVNTIHRDGDLTAHAEMEAIRTATKAAGNSRLDGTIMYASGHPCPMCLAAMYLGGVSAVYYAFSQEDAEPFDLSTADIYDQLAQPASQRRLPMQQLDVADSPTPYELWHASKPAD